MRTTVDLPPAVMRAAKARSAARGESLKTLLTRAVAAELGSDPAEANVPQRVTLPLFGRSSGPRVNPSNADLERALADAEAAGVSGSPRPPRRRRPRR
jgi:hypothetical protein